MNSDSRLTNRFAFFAPGEIYRLCGEERTKFLNAYNSQDILRMDPYLLTPGAFLTQKGKVVSDVQIVARSDDFLLLFEAGYGNKVATHLELFLKFTKVSFEKIAPPWICLGVWGAKAENALRSFVEADPATFRDQESSWRFEAKPAASCLMKSNRWSQPGLEWLTLGLAPAEITEAFRNFAAAHTLREISAAEQERLRIKAGIPKMGIDMNEETLAAEATLDRYAVSFNKGCYLGQEITARVHSRGHIQRSLQRLNLSSPSPPSLPADILQGQEKVGTLTSLVPAEEPEQWVGLGMVSRLAWQDTRDLTVSGLNGKAVRLKRIGSLLPDCNGDDTLAAT